MKVNMICEESHQVETINQWRVTRRHPMRVGPGESSDDQFIGTAVFDRKVVQTGEIQRIPQEFPIRAKNFEEAWELFAHSADQFCIAASTIEQGQSPPAPETVGGIVIAGEADARRAQEAVTAMAQAGITVGP